ncbi:N-6 DNA methylase [bacterium]|nr:N-6 DNA methylase [bacterium]
MDKKQAQALIKETFESPFDKNKFVGFVKNLLNEVEEATFIYKGNYIPDAYEQYINTLERIGKYNDGEHKIDILIVKLKEQTSIERARTMQRNFIAWYLNVSRGGGKDAALVAFVSPNEDDWRFSLVKMDYRFDDKGKVKEEFTPARRWSFLVGKNENSHTAKSHLVPIIEDDEHNPTLARLEDAFNIEKVTKEFFEKYRELFLWTKETLDALVFKDNKIRADFEAKGVNTVDFAKKLLGQIVFLYFLQKKGWFGVKRDAEWGTGPKNFLRELFEGKHAAYKNFFNDILEPLFYEVLSRERDDNFYSRFNCKIPFLDGGLFDPINNYDWVHTDIFLPNDLFSNDYKTKEGDKGNRILDIFDLYNFTVKEDEPLEKEVAVDPEMLGKVFENLLEVKDRKSKGTYYTPREIVHYMCQQSLINYLATELEGKVSKNDSEIIIKYGEQIGENEARVEAKGRETDTYSYKLPESIRQNAKLIDNKLANIKVCDPAIGSGAFPVGMMGEITKARNVLSAFIKEPSRTIYLFKRECIEKSLYGVDIDPSAVEIAKLRLWLSLVVDEEDIKQIKPLPNLDYKIVCGNSLLGVEKNLFNQRLFEELERLKPLLFNETSPKKKQEYKKQIDELISQITNGHKEFDFEVYFSEVFHEKKGFDVVIANPPYGADYSVNEKKHFLKRYLTTKTITNVQKGSLDTFTIFIELGYNVLKKCGTLNYIVPISITSSDSMTALHKLLEENCEIIKVSSYSVRPQPVFENAVVDTSIILFKKSDTKCEHIYSTKMYRKNKNYDLQHLVNNLQFIDVVDVKLQGRYPKISQPIEKEILGKIFKQDKTISDLLVNDGKSIYYRTSGGRYFKVITNYSTGSTKEKAIYLPKSISNSIGAILSSNLFFWYYQIFSNNHDLKSYEIESFKIPYSKIISDKEIIEKIEKLYDEYLEDIEANANVRQTTRYANIDSFKEYKIGKSKKLIDRIDDIIGPLYGLTKEEIEFIKNYEIEFRLGKDID